MSEWVRGEEVILGGDFEQTNWNKVALQASSIYLNFKVLKIKKIKIFSIF